MRQLVLISGRICNGKSGLARRLGGEFGYLVVRTSSLLTEEARKRGVSCDRLSLQKLGDTLDGETEHRWLLDEIQGIAATLPENVPIVVDNIRTRQQLAHFRSKHDWEIVHAHLWAPIFELEKRFERRNAENPSQPALHYSQADLLKNEEDVVFFKGDADVRINTAHTDGRDTLVRVAARLGLYSPPDVRCVDVLVGG